MGSEIPPTMRAVAMTGKGPPTKDILHIIQKPVPKVKDSELLVRVVCAGVNVVDCKMRAGKVPGWKVTQKIFFFSVLEHVIIQVKIAPFLSFQFVNSF